MNQERNMHRSSTIYKLKQYKTALNKYVGGFWCERTTEDGLFHWRKHYYRLWMHILARSEGLKLNTLMLDLFQLLSSPDVNWWTGVLWIIVMFLSSVWTLILTAPIHCRASIAETVMQCYISPNLFRSRNKLIYILDGKMVSKRSFTWYRTHSTFQSLQTGYHPWKPLHTPFLHVFQLKGRKRQRFITWTAKDGYTLIVQICL